MDATLVMCTGVYLNVLKARVASVSTVGNPALSNIAEQPALVTAESNWLLSCQVAAAAIFRTILLLFACLPALSRTDLLAFGLVVLAVLLFWGNTVC